MNDKSSNYYQWVILIILTMTQMCAALSTQSIGILAGFWKYDFVLSNFEIGLLASLLNIAPIVGILFMGKILDYHGERGPIAAGMAIISLSLLIMSQVKSYELLLVMLFFNGVGYGPIQPGGSRAVYSWFNNKKLGLAMGIRQASVPLGGMLAAIILPYIILHSNWRYAVLFTTLATAISSIIFFIFYRNPVYKQKSSSKLLSLKQVLNILLEPEIGRISLLGAVLVAVQTFILVFWILLLHNQGKISLPRATSYLIWVQMFGVIGRVFLSFMGGRIKNGYNKILLIIMIVLIITLLNVIYISANSSHYLIYLISGILGFCGFGWYGPWVILLSNKSRFLGATLSASMALNQIAIVITPVIIGKVLDASHHYKVVVIMVVSLLSITLLFNIKYLYRSVNE